MSKSLVWGSGAAVNEGVVNQSKETMREFVRELRRKKDKKIKII